MRVFISAGEASGDALGAAFIRSLRSRVPDLVAFGMGGPRMEAEGFVAHRSSNELNVVGLVEVVRHLPRLFSLVDALGRFAEASNPDLVVLIDAPDFHVRLAKRLKKCGFPVLGYVAPSVWAWRSGRVSTFKRWFDRLLLLFPFETPHWTAKGVDAVCVGHPLVDELQDVGRLPDPENAIALLPGSRGSEIRRHLPLMLAAALKARDAGLVETFRLPVASSLPEGTLEAALRGHPIAPQVVLVPAPQLHQAVARSKMAWVGSGTATLEVALLGRPQLIFYRTHWLTYCIGRALMRVPHFGLPNLIAGEEAIPELLQGACTASALFEYAKQVLGDSRALDAAQGLREALLRRMGGPGAAHRAADAALELAGRPRTSGAASEPA